MYVSWSRASVKWCPRFPNVWCVPSHLTVHLSKSADRAGSIQGEAMAIVFTVASTLSAGTAKGFWWRSQPAPVTPQAVGRSQQR